MFHRFREISRVLLTRDTSGKMIASSAAASLAFQREGERVMTLVSGWKHVRKLRSLCASLGKTVLGVINGSSSSIIERNYVALMEKIAILPLASCRP